jgi:uncharacterized RDD family membrane protein YckC
MPAKVRAGLATIQGETAMQQPPPLPSVNPYAAPTARVVDVIDEGDQVLADRGIRLAAALVDGVIVGMVSMLAIFAMPMLAGNNRAAAGAVMVLLVGGALLAVLIVNMVLLHRHGQTIAKRLFKIKIVRSDGSRCGLRRVIFARWFPITLLSAVPFIGFLISITDSLLIFRDDYRCIHDHIADTIVIKA